MADPVERRRKAQKKKYPKHWKRISERIRFDRAEGKCEWCAKPHGQQVTVGAHGCWADNENQWYNEFGIRIPGPLPWPTRFWWDFVIKHKGKVPQLRVSTVILQTAHLDHNPKNCADGNLAALCQFCHATYDGEQRLWSGRISRDLRNGQKVMWQ
ncbi:MAG: hypothetical protein ACYTDT_13705 [Planctomycetota bacterium]|jgi:hypothetical protein